METFDHQILLAQAPAGCTAGKPFQTRCHPTCNHAIAQSTSVRFIKRLLSGFNTTASGATGAEKLGHPLPESNFAAEENNRFPHPAQTYVPSEVS